MKRNKHNNRHTTTHTTLNIDSIQVLLRREQEQQILLEQHIKELEDKLIMVRGNMQQQKEEYRQEEKKTWFGKLLKK